LGFITSNEYQIKNCTIQGAPTGDYAVNWNTECEQYAPFICNHFIDSTWVPYAIDDVTVQYGSCSSAGGFVGCVEDCFAVYDSGIGTDWYCTPLDLDYCDSSIRRTDFDIFYSKFYDLFETTGGTIEELSLDERIDVSYNANSNRFRIRVLDEFFYGVTRLLVKLINVNTGGEWYQTFDLYVNVNEHLFIGLPTTPAS